jgi:hypothetical protein
MLAQLMGSVFIAAAVSSGTRDPAAIPVADVLSLYVRDKVADHARPDWTAIRMKFLQAFWGERRLSEVNGQTCREYARQCSTPAAARRHLEDLRSAINHHRREGLHDRIVSVVLPPKGAPRERWLTREEAARFVIKAWPLSSVADARRVDPVISRSPPRRDQLATRAARSTRRHIALRAPATLSGPHRQ